MDLCLLSIDVWSVSMFVCAIQHIFKSIHWNLCECRQLFVYWKPTTPECTAVIFQSFVITPWYGWPLFSLIFFSKKYLAQLYFMSLIHMKYFLIKYVCLTTIMTTLVSLNCNCVKSVTVELNVKAKYYHMLCVSKAV